MKKLNLGDPVLSVLKYLYKTKYSISDYLFKSNINPSDYSFSYFGDLCAFYSRIDSEHEFQKCNKKTKPKSFKFKYDFHYKPFPVKRPSPGDFKDFSEAFRDADSVIDYTCPKCDGRGYHYCTKCRGTGEVVTNEEEVVVCSQCGGTGKGSQCFKCDGEGELIDFDEYIYKFEHKIFLDHTVPEGDNSDRLQRKYKSFTKKNRYIPLKEQFDIVEIEKLSSLNNNTIRLDLREANSKFIETDQDSKKIGIWLFSKNHFGFNPVYYIIMRYRKKIRTFWSISDAESTENVSFTLNVSILKSLILFMIICSTALIGFGSYLQDYIKFLPQENVIIITIVLFITFLLILFLSHKKKYCLVGLMSSDKLKGLQLLSIIGSYMRTIYRRFIPDTFFWRISESIYTVRSNLYRGMNTYSIISTSNKQYHQHIRMIELALKNDFQRNQLRKISRNIKKVIVFFTEGDTNANRNLISDLNANFDFSTPKQEIKIMLVFYYKQEKDFANNLIGEIRKVHNTYDTIYLKEINMTDLSIQNENMKKICKFIIN